MKKLLSGLLKGRDNRISGLIAFAIVGMVVLGCNCNKEGGFSFGEAKIPAEAELERMVQNTMQDFTSAIEKEDFSAFRANTSSQFQKQFTNEALVTAFNTFIEKKDLIVPILRSSSSMKPAYSPAPNISKENMVQVLNVNGQYATNPVPTNFELQYLHEDEQWKLIKIIVKLQ